LEAQGHDIKAFPGRLELRASTDGVLRFQQEAYSEKAAKALAYRLDEAL
jgi:hypothetical protein